MDKSKLKIVMVTKNNTAYYLVDDSGEYECMYSKRDERFSPLLMAGSIFGFEDMEDWEDYKGSQDIIKTFKGEPKLWD